MKISIEKAIKNKGLTVKKTAERSGLEPNHISAYKCGSRSMGRKAATKLAETLDTSPEVLLVGNRAEVLNRAAKRGDRIGVLNVAKGLVEVADEYATPGSDLADKLDRLTKYAITFAETATGKTI